MIDVQNLSLTIGAEDILSDVSFQIGDGKIFGLVGESGSGKSMTALSLIGLLPNGMEVSGSAWLDGTELLTLPEAQMCQLRGREMSMIFQEPMTALNPVRTIGDQITEVLAIHGQVTGAGARRIARDRLDRVGLKQVGLDRFPHELSGGQRQRVCIAAAIALRPRLLIADEPTTALDVTTQAQILDLLKELVTDDGMSLLLITHDLAVVSVMADRIAVMQSGRIVEQGDTTQVLRDQAHPYTRTLFAASSHQPNPLGRAKDTTILQVAEVHRHYPGRRRGMRRGPPVRAVNGVSFEIKDGESLGLVGESGCGKSTLTRIILGLDPATSGQIILNGYPVSTHMPRAQRADIQVVFQDPYGSFNPRWQVDRIVSEPFHLLHSPPERGAAVAAALEAVRLSADDALKYPHEFSGGQRQRIAIARALITRPKLLVLDEAVSALDVSVRAQILDLLTDLQGQFGLSYLFISHDLTVVRSITDRVLVMQAGRIVEQGQTETVFSSPTHSYTKALLAAVPGLDTTA